MKPITVIDCETDPFLHGRTPEPFLWGYYDGNYFQTFNTTKDICSFLTGQTIYAYAHNGGKFDFHYMLPHIKFTKSLIINGRIVEMQLGKCTLRDSFAILPMALVQYKKDSIDYGLFEKGIREKHMPEIISYLRGDCIYLYELVTAFLAEFGNKVTLASAGFNKAKEMDSIAHFKTNRFFYKLFKPYYHGGRVSVFDKAIITGQTYIYDLNSAYPFAMVHQHPFGNNVKVYYDNEIVDPLSFYRVVGVSKGVFPYLENERKLSYPDDNTEREYSITGYELQAALDTETFTGKIIRRIQFLNTISFDNYIKHYYAQKANSPKGSISYILSKLAMNSVYGKLGANPDRYFDYIICAPNQTRRMMARHNAALAYLGDTYSLLATPIAEHRKRFYNVATAASITGFVRALLWRAIHNIQSRGYTVYYCDTDSIITDCSNLKTSNELGDWKLEQTNDLLYIYAPKIYAARDTNTKKWKVASKGVQLTPAQVRLLINGSEVTWQNPAPTFGIRKDTTFIARTLKGRRKS